MVSVRTVRRRQDHRAAAIAGLDRPDAGSIRCGDEVWYDGARGIHLRPQKRRVGYLSQDYALFPHLTVRRNVAYGARGWTVDDLLARFELSETGGPLSAAAIGRPTAARGPGARAGGPAAPAAAGRAALGARCAHAGAPARRSAATAGERASARHRGDARPHRGAGPGRFDRHHDRRQAAPDGRGGERL